MICRRCGAELPDNAIRCSNCGIKVNMYCPECKTINAFGTQICKNCGFELLKHCPVCGSFNIYSATVCRKCKSPLEKYQSQLKEDIKELGDFEVVSSFSSPHPTYIKSEFDATMGDFVEESKSAEDELPLVESLTVEKNDYDVEKIFNIDIENNEQAENTEIKASNDETESSTVSEKDEEVNILDENIEVEQLTEEIDASVVESISDENAQEKDKEEVSEDNSIDIQKEAVLKIINFIKNSLVKNVIAVNGVEGSGKSAVLKQVADSLSTKGFLSLYGSCTPLVQITSFGFFQDAFLRIMGFPPYTNSTESFIKDFRKSNFSKVFSFLEGDELTSFLNIFYPSQKDSFENILTNKQKMFSILEKVIKSFLVNNNLIISIDNFELLDGASYDFILHLMRKGFFNNRLKLLVAYQENKSIQSYFDMTDIDENMFETVLIKKFSKDDLVSAVSKSTFIKIDEIFDEEHLDKLVQKSDGNAIRMEQEVALLFDSGYISLKDNDIVINEDNKPEFNPINKTQIELFKYK